MTSGSFTHLSDVQLLESLRGVLRTQRRALAELVAHLGEVEDRRLHLEAGHGSMFTYCVARLGMSEDEACRRIELARLARRFPALLGELESGRITLSVALVLKPVLSPSNHLELLAAAQGKCIRQARELVAERFPREDAPSSIRKLPERPMPAPKRKEAGSAAPSSAVASLPSLFASAPGSATYSAVARPTSLADDVLAASSPRPSPPLSSVDHTSAQIELAAPSVPTSVPAAAVAEPPGRSALRPSSPAVDAQARPATPRAGSAPHTGSTNPVPAVTAAETPREVPPVQSPISRSVIEPLSAQRYRVQFTADAALKQQLELARNLLRHAHPNGDFGPILSRALTLLIDDLMRRRFGARARRSSPRPARAKPEHAPSPLSASAANADSSPADSAPNTPASAPAGPVSSSSTVKSISPTTPSAYVPRAARRAVLERDGLECSWVDADGVRCGNQAWLEFDHRQPRGKHGSSEPENLRLLCRAHNLLAAEHAYGRDHIERCARRRGTEGAPRPPA